MKSNKLKLSLQEIAEVTGESLPLIHDAIKAAHLKTFVVGRRRFARPSAVAAWIGFLEKQSDAGTPVKYRARPADRRACPCLAFGKAQTLPPSCKSSGNRKTVV